jgi:hypothetical protein
MPAPEFVTVTKETVIKVATGVTAGFIRKVKPGSPGATYLHTYVPTTGAAPVEEDFRGGRIFVNGDAEEIVASESIDIYLWLTGNEDGEVRVDV